MAEVTYYVALPFIAGDEGIAAGEPAEFANSVAVAMRAEALSLKEGHVGAVAFSRTGDPGTGDFSDAKVIEKFGDVPDDLSAVMRASLMTNFATDLKKSFDVVLLDRLEAYWVLPDGKTIERSDETESAIKIFEILLASIDAIPSSLIKAAEELRAAEPEIFKDTLSRGLLSVGYGFSPASATEFVEVLNRTVQRDMAAA
jgi:hypothetical protein